MPGVVCADAQPQSDPVRPTERPRASYALGTGSIAGNRTPAQFTLSKKQLRINQRVSQAAIRRINVIQPGSTPAWWGRHLRRALGPEVSASLQRPPDVVERRRSLSLNIAARARVTHPDHARAAAADQPASR